jgi:leucyl/phenylalanyl-tRNA--protein transferase
MAVSTLPSDELYIPVDAQRTGSLADLGLAAPKYFPSPLVSTIDGLVCVGGRLTPDWLLDAYRHGIFPWPVWDDEPMAWWSLDPRAIYEFECVRIPRRLKRTIRSGKFRVTCNRDFSGVIHSCGTVGDRAEGTWLTPSMIAAYTELHRLGHAHSVEVWHGNELAGGTYGVAIGGLFAAESMFHRVRDASKVALVYLLAHLKTRGFQFCDIQQWTPHTGWLGAIMVPRCDYLRRLAAACDLSATFGNVMTDDPLARIQR